VVGNFNAHYFDPATLDPQLDTEEKTYSLLSQLTALEAFGTDQPVEFRFERRQGLSTPGLKKWYRDFEKLALASIYGNPGAPTYFPAVSFQISNKNDPGIQCVDFILWTVNRLIDGDTRWYDRLSVNFRMTTGPRSDNSGSVDLIFRKDLSDPPCKYSNKDAPGVNDPPVPYRDLCNIYIEAERVVNYYANNPIPISIQHLKPELIRVANNCLVIGRNDQVADVATCFLKLFDMVPLITGNTPGADKKTLLVARQQLALCLRTDLLDGIRTHDYLARARRLTIKQNAGVLTF
jgi:hypothetical protein